MNTTVKKVSFWLLGLGALLAVVVACSEQRQPQPIPPNPPGHPSASEAYQRPPANPLKNAYFGETHLHTTYSMDANLFGTKNDPRMAYRFAKGEAVLLPESNQMQQLKAPLDFAAVTDHAEGLGMFEQCNNPDASGYWSLDCVGMRFQLILMFKRLVGANKQEAAQKGQYNASVCGEQGERCIESAKGVWQDIQSAANEYNQPGKFTAFIGFEYSPTLNSTGMIHRNVIFRGSQVPDNVFSAFDGFAEDLLRWLDSRCQGDCQALSIPHNPNWSWGLMFGQSNSDATPLTRENLALRAKLESLVEIFQVKGNSECAKGVGNNDEQCGFENLWPACTAEQAKIDPLTGQHAPRCIAANDTVRDVLKKGLLEQPKWGFNPYKLGFVGGTDNHNGTPGDTEENTWNGHGGKPDSTPGYRLGYDSNLVADALGFPLTALNPGGLTGVWAEENTREAIFDAMKRKETFATSGSRLRVRMFAGYDFAPGLAQQADAIKTAYASGVPMGSDLSAAKPGQAPSFLVQAMQDAHSAPLQKVQIVKGWAAGGEAFEAVYDIACADGLKPDAKTHRCADNGAKVNLSDCSISADKGAAELATTWTDPDFRAEESAFYYVRVLENPVCRWSQHDANQLGKAHPAGFASTVQERAWSSPVWYNPSE